MKELKKNLKRFLRKYEGIEDIIIFGSFVKDKFEPKDIDIAIISQDKNPSIVGEISSSLSEKTDIEVLSNNQIYQTRIGLSIISEGFSVKENKFLRDMLGIEAKKIYSYDLKGLSASQKRAFNRALKEHLNKINGERLGSGCVMIPIEKTGFFEDFLEVWNLNVKSKEYKVW